MMRAVLRSHGVSDRTVWLADSFAGLPPPNVDQHPADAGAVWHRWTGLAVPLAEVRENFRRYGLLDEQVRFLEGWFKDTLPGVAERRWSLIRLDGDMYGSTIDALNNLYPNLSPGGHVIIDDYGAVPACRSAVDDYRAAHGITEPIERIDASGACWRRELG
jgi:O-methyltransferase